MIEKDRNLFDYKYKSKKVKTYHEVCQYCHKEFEFTNNDVKDRLIKCPYCNRDIIFFPYKYE